MKMNLGISLILSTVLGTYLLDGPCCSGNTHPSVLRSVLEFLKKILYPLLTLFFLKRLSEVPRFFLFFFKKERLPFVFTKTILLPFSPQ